MAYLNRNTPGLVISPKVLNLIRDIHFLLLCTIYFAFNKNLCKAVLEKWGRKEMLESF